MGGGAIGLRGPLIIGVWCKRKKRTSKLIEKKEATWEGYKKGKYLIGHNLL